jgi:ubiquinone biosynthesis protein UbiJ
LRRAFPPLPSLDVFQPVQAVAHAFNLLARQQPWAAERLARHAEKTLRIVLGGLSLTFQISDVGQLIPTEVTSTPDVVLEINPQSFDPMTWLSSTSRPDIAEYVHVSGQAALAQVVSELARDLRPDPEDALAQWFGDVAARRIVQGARTAAIGFSHALRGLGRNVAEYLSEETDALVGRPAMQAFVHDQSRAQARLSGLEQRAAELSTRLRKLEANRSTVR